MAKSVEDRHQRCAARAAGELARYATACAVDPICSGEKPGRKYINVLEPNNFRNVGSSPCFESIARSHCIFHQPMSMSGSAFIRYQVPRWKKTKTIVTAISIERIRSG